MKWVEQVSELMSCRSLPGASARPGRVPAPTAGSRRGSPAGSLSVTYQNQQECLFMRNGSRYMVATPSGRGGRSLSADLVLLDEAFSFEDMRALGAIQPTLATRPLGQFLVLSSAGTSASVLLQPLPGPRARGRREGDWTPDELDDLGRRARLVRVVPPRPDRAHDDPTTW